MHQLYNTQSSLLNSDLDLFLLSVLPTELLPPKILFMLSSCKPLSHFLLKALFSQEPSKSQVFPSGLSLSRFVMSSTPVLLLESQGKWNYNTELLGFALSHLIIFIMEYEDLEDFQIEKLFDIIIRLETSKEERKPVPRDLVFYLVNSPDDWTIEHLKLKTIEVFQRKWGMFPKTQIWDSLGMDSIFTIEVRSFKVNKNKTDYVPIGFLTKSHQEDLKMPELYCMGGICDEILRMVKEGHEYLDLIEVRKRCYILQTKRTFKMLLKEFQEEILKVKKSYEKKVFDNMKGYCHEILNKSLSRYEIRTQGLKGSFQGEQEVSNTLKEFKESMINELTSFSKTQKTLILGSAEENFNNELNKVLKKFKETKSFSLLTNVKTIVLEKIETSLLNTDIDFLQAERSPLLQNALVGPNYGEIITLEDLMARFQSKIQAIAEKEHKFLLNNLIETLNQESMKIVELSLRGEELLQGKEFWRKLNKKLQGVQDKHFSLFRRDLMNLQIPESIISGEIDKISNNQKTFLDFELEKKKYKLEDFIMKGVLEILNKKIMDYAKNSYLLEKQDLNQREMVLKEWKGFCVSMMERMEENVKEMRYMEGFDGKLWLSAEEINLIILSLRQNLERESRELTEKLKSADRKIFIKRVGILALFILLLVLIFIFIKGFYVKAPLTLLVLGFGIFFSKLVPFKKRKKNFYIH